MAIYTHDNPNLTCISVVDSNWSTANWTVYNSNIYPQFYFSTSYLLLSSQELTINKALFKAVDLVGREKNKLINLYFTSMMME